jgi:Ser/Thr protein kinase RdoA (MazF antagonist)
VPDYEQIAAEFALGRPLAVAALSGGGRGVVKLTTSEGIFVIKPCRDRASAELYISAAAALNANGIRQAVPRMTADRSAIGRSGYLVQEFLPGRICQEPTRAQITATMRHVAEYHRALADVPPPAVLRVTDTIWKRVVSVEFLLRELPGLLQVQRTWPDRPADCRQIVEAALDLVRHSLPLLSRLPRQLVHGDIGPDNVLMDGDRVISIIDFTPYDEPFLFALSSAVYWYHVYGRDNLELDSIRESLAAVSASAVRGPWTKLEAEAWPIMLVREALRRLATPLAVADQAGSPAEARPVAARYRALRSVIRARTA